MNTKVAQGEETMDRRLFLRSVGSLCCLAACPAFADGKVTSGDVELFYRSFGKPGKTPVLVMHGANYFDSYDWVGVASALAVDREVIAYDMRGFGESTWSPSKNYSADALLADASAILAHAGWKQAIIMGHSFSGRLAVSFAARHPEVTTRLIVVDSAFGRDEPTPKGIGNPPVVFASVEDAMARFAKLATPPRISRDRERALLALRQTSAGYQLKRDPDYGNAVPVGFSGAVQPVRERDVWSELQKVKAPMLFVRGLQSNRFVPDIVTRLEREFPQIRWATADSMHDIPYYKPDELIAAVRGYIADV